MKNQLFAYFLLPQKKTLPHLIGHCLFCKTAAVGKDQVDRNIFLSFRLFCQKLTSYQICFHLEMKGIACAYLTSQCRFLIWINASHFVWGGKNIFRNLFNYNSFFNAHDAAKNLLDYLSQGLSTTTRSCLTPPKSCFKLTGHG